VPFCEPVFDTLVDWILVHVLSEVDDSTISGRASFSFQLYLHDTGATILHNRLRPRQRLDSICERRQLINSSAKAAYIERNFSNPRNIKLKLIFFDTDKFTS
jgi:hypothetical protein